jgi:hypothetical protein
VKLFPQQQQEGKTKTGQIEVPLRGGNTFVTHAAHMWNRSATLQQATSKAKAKKAASDFASLTPL